MRLSRGNLCFTVSLVLCQAFLFSEFADAQQRSSRRTSSSTRATEKVARASWQPVRGADEPSLDETETQSGRIRQASARVPVAGQPASRTVRQMSGHHDAPPLPPSKLGAPGRGSVRAATMQAPIIEGGHVPMDGQVVLGPIHEGDVIYEGGAGCDAFPGGGCGCGEATCDGFGCDSMGCDSCGPGGCGELIGGNAWRPCATVCLPQDGWFSVEYLSWWQDGMNLPPLVSSNAMAVPQAQAGVRGAPGYQTLFGDDEVLIDNFDGARIGFGIWLDKCHTWGIGADLFRIGRESVGFQRESSGDPILARPFFNTETGLEDSELVAFPGVVSGRINVDASSELQGWGIHLRRLGCASEGCTGGFFCGCPQHFCRRTEGLFGYRGMQLDEDVVIRERLTGTTSGEQFDITDRFHTRNQFNGIDLGWNQRLVRGYWTFDTGVRLALGNNKQTVTIAGTSIITDPTGSPNTPQTFNGGLLAQRSNIGVRERDQFAVVPELNAKLGYQLTDNLRITLGYTFLYISNVVRPGEHISTDLNPALLPPESTPFTGVLRPSFAFDTTDYWAQGISVGGEYRW